MASLQKQQAALKKAKAKKQKKILFALAPVLLLILVFMGPGLLKNFTGGGKKTAPPVVAPDLDGDGHPDPAGSTPPPTSGAAPTTAAPAAGATGTTTPVAPTATTLDDTDGVSDAGPGQLVSFDRFIGRDPFQQGIEAKPPDAGGVPGGAPGGAPKPPKSGGGSTGGSTGGGTTGGSGGDAYTSAKLEVNGVEQTVAEDGTFPEDDPIFKLVAVKKGSIEIGLVAGEFNASDQTISVKVGKSVTLVSQPDGLRYVIKLVSVS